MSCLVALFACFPQTSTGRELCLYVTGWRPLQQAPKADAQILINRFALGHGKLENHVLSTEVSTMTSSLVHKLHFQTHKSIFCSFSCGHEKACSVPLCCSLCSSPTQGLYSALQAEVMDSEPLQTRCAHFASSLPPSTIRSRNNDPPHPHVSGAPSIRGRVTKSLLEPRCGSFPRVASIRAGGRGPGDALVHCFFGYPGIRTLTLN